MIGFGILLCYCLGCGFYWRYVAVVPPILYLLQFIALLPIPESPIWTLGHKGNDEGRKALEWLRYMYTHISLDMNLDIAKLNILFV